MSIPTYVPTSFVNGSVPAINATNLNKLGNAVAAVTDEVNAVDADVQDLRINPIKATSSQVGGAKMWLTGDVLNISTL